MGDLLDGYALPMRWTRCSRRPTSPRAHYAVAARGARHAVARRLRGAVRGPRPGVPRPGHHVLALGRGAAVPARPRARASSPPTSGRSSRRASASGCSRSSAFLADVYGPGEILADGVVPRRLVDELVALPPLPSPGSSRAGGVRVHVAGIDLVRDGAGRFRVLEDNLRTPSGISYVIENRRAMTHVFPELFASHRIRRVADYPLRLLEAFRATAPPGVDDPCVVVLTPGRPQRGVLRALVPRPPDGRRAGRGPRPRVPRPTRLHAHDRAASSGSTSCTGASTTTSSTRCTSGPTRCSAAPGILNAARAGNVTIANAPGNGVADDKAVYPYVPGDDRVLPRRGADPRQRRDLPARGRRRVRVGARPPRPARVQAGRRLGRLRPRDRAARRRGDARRAAGEGARRPARLDRAGAGRAVDRADVRRRPDGRPPPRPAAVRGERRRATSGSCPAGSPGSRCPKGAWS